MDHIVEIDISYIPWHIIDWLNDEQFVHDGTDYSWGWTYGEYENQRFRLMFVDENLALLTMLKWSGEYKHQCLM